MNENCEFQVIAGRISAWIGIKYTMDTRDEADAFMIGLAPVHLQAGLAGVDSRAKETMLSYTAFKERLLQTPIGGGRDPWFMALLLNHSRLFENLDGCRIATIAGRPALAKAALRMIYEGFTNILVIGFHIGDVTSANLNRNVKIQEAVTREYLAERFLGFGHFAIWQQVEHLLKSATDQGRELVSDKSLLLLETDPDRSIQVIRESGQVAAARFEFNDRSFNWHPFKHANALRKHLWPEEEQPLFPANHFSLARSTWDDLYFIAYKSASHEVHGSPAALLSSLRLIEGIQGLIHDTPHFEAHVLENAINIAVLASAAFADALGLMEHWNGSFS